MGKPGAAATILEKVVAGLARGTLALPGDGRDGGGGRHRQDAWVGLGFAGPGERLVSKPGHTRTATAIGGSAAVPRADMGN